MDFFKENWRLPIFDYTQWCADIRTIVVVNKHFIAKMIIQCPFYNYSLNGTLAALCPMHGFQKRVALIFV